MEVEWSDFLKKDITIQEAFQVYEKTEIRPAGLSNNTANSYRNAGKLLSEYFGNVKILDIRIEDLQDFYQHLLSWQKPDTVRGNMVCVRAVFKFCSRKGVGNIDIEDIKIPKREKREIQWLTRSEVEQFIEIVGKPKRGYSDLNRLRNIAICWMLFCTGLRVSELCRLNRNSIKNRQFTVIGKSKSPRICFINENVEKILDEYLKKRTDNSKALFISQETGLRIRPETVRRVFSRACEQSDFKNVHPHTFRHSFATFMLEKGVDIRYVGELLGHESLDTTKMYTHITNPKLKAIYDEAYEKEV